MAVSDWRKKLIDAIIGHAKAKGYEKYSWEVARNVLDELVVIDQGRERKNRVCANYFINEYKATDRAIQVLMGQVEKYWAEIGPKQESAKPLFDKITDSSPQPPVPPDIRQPAPKPDDQDEALAEKLGDLDAYLECVISIRLTVNQKLTKEEIEEYLAGKEILRHVKFKISRFVEVIDNWHDLHISYNLHLAKLYDCLFEHALVEDAVTKPLADFGRRTAAYKRAHVTI